MQPFNFEAVLRNRFGASISPKALSPLTESFSVCIASTLKTKKHEKVDKLIIELPVSYTFYIVLQIKSNFYHLKRSVLLFNSNCSRPLTFLNNKKQRERRQFSSQWLIKCTELYLLTAFVKINCLYSPQYVSKQYKMHVL